MNIRGLLSGAIQSSVAKFILNVSPDTSPLISLIYQLFCLELSALPRKDLSPVASHSVRVKLDSCVGF